MKVSQSSYTIGLNEEELKTAIGYYMKWVHGKDIAIEHLKHLVGERTEGYGLNINIPYQEGVEIVVIDVNQD